MTDLVVSTVGLGSYCHQPAWNLGVIADQCRQAVERLFTDHGAHPQNWTGQATKESVRATLEKWTADAERSHVVYWVGHGEHSDDGYLVALANSTAPLTDRTGMPGRDLASAVRDQLRHRGDEESWTLLVLHTCGSGPGAWELWRSFPTPPRNFGVIATAEQGAAFSTGFTATLAEVLDGFTGNDTAGIPLRELMARLRDRIEIGGQDKKIHEAFTDTAFLARPADHDGPLQAPGDVYAELRSVLAQAAPEIRNHFYAKAQGAEVGEAAWHFTGRQEERRQVARWLRSAEHGMFVVTGAAGSGKSAVLGMLLASSDTQILAALDQLPYAKIRADLRMPWLTFDAAIHLSGRTAPEAVQAIATALGATADNPDQLRDHLRHQAGHNRKLTVLVDALDEARDTLTIAALLRSLAAVDGLRLVVGTRQSLHETPDQPAPDRAVLDALAVPQDAILRLQPDPTAVFEYVQRRLADHLPRALPGQFADIIASYGQPFLFARLATYEILAEPFWAATPDNLRALLGAGHTGIFAHAVDRIRRQNATAEALLHVLTYARGNGFPRTGGIWAVAASALTGHDVTDIDVEAALKLAPPYIMYDSEAGQSVYRLAHRSFAEWYRRIDDQP